MQKSKGVTTKVEKRLLSDIPAITKKGPTVNAYEIYLLWYVLHEYVAVEDIVLDETSFFQNHSSN